MFRCWGDTGHCFDMCKDCDSLGWRCRVDRVWRIGHRPNLRHNHNALSTGDTCSNNSSPLLNISQLNSHIIWFSIANKNQIENISLMINQWPYVLTQVDLAHKVFLLAQPWENQWGRLVCQFLGTFNSDKIGNNFAKKIGKCILFVLLEG